DALITMKINLGSEGAQPKLHNSWYINENSERCVQSMIFSDNHQLKRQPKGIKVPEVLVSVPILSIRKFTHKSWRYIDAYNKGLEGRTAE
ncbi:5421_t:CDS:2, partial [Funneliformis caledonium]